jgi:hypothetical protein
MFWSRNSTVPALPGSHRQCLSASLLEVAEVPVLPVPVLVVTVTVLLLVAVVVVLVLVLVPVLKGVGSREGADGWQHANKIQNYISVDLRARIRVKVLLLVLY